jgi:hypothetical protein
MTSEKTSKEERSFFDIFTDRESDRMEVIMAEVAGAAWAQPILNNIRKGGGLVGKNMELFFELRFGHALYDAGVTVEYEVEGEADSTIDFGFSSKNKSWKTELMRIKETDAAKSATTEEIDDNGIRWIKRVLSFHNKNRTQSLEGESLVAIQKICEKCLDEGLPHKFKIPTDALHAIIVDMRTFKRGGDIYDRLHIGLGGEYVVAPYRMYWVWGDPPKEKQRLISGVFNTRTTVKGANEVRNLVHFIGFLRETTFKPGEIGAALEFVANPYLFENASSVEAALDTWPLQPARLLNYKEKNIGSGDTASIVSDFAWPGMWRLRLPNGLLSEMVNATRAKDALRALRVKMSRARPQLKP